MVVNKFSFIEANVSIKLDSLNQKFYLNSLILNHNLFDKNNVKNVFFLITLKKKIVSKVFIQEEN